MPSVPHKPITDPDSQPSLNLPKARTIDIRNARDPKAAERLMRLEHKVETTNLRAHLLPEDLKNKFLQKTFLVLAQNLASCGHKRNAAQIYEHLQMYDKVRELRPEQNQIVIRTVNISVDLNALLQDIKKGGILVVYRCPNCGGKLKIGKDTQLESLRTCEHCDREIEVMEMVDFLRTALS